MYTANGPEAMSGCAIMELNALIVSALSVESDDEYYSLLREAQSSLSDDELLRTGEILLDGSEDEAELGAALLLALSQTEPDIRAKALRLLHALVQSDRTDPVIATGIMALFHFRDESNIPLLVKLIGSNNQEVRQCLAKALARHSPTREVVDSLITLTDDPAEEVRDWATFEFANSLFEIDSPNLRRVLKLRLGDESAGVRGNAALALAIRKDGSAIPVLQEFLSQDSVDDTILEAVRMLGDEKLLSLAAEKFGDALKDDLLDFEL